MNWRAFRLTLAGMWAGSLATFVLIWIGTDPFGWQTLANVALMVLPGWVVYGNIADWQRIDREEGYLDGLERIVRETFPEEPGQRLEGEHDETAV